MEKMLHPAVLVCERDEGERRRICDLLSHEYQVVTASKISDALIQIQRGAFILILLSLDGGASSQELSIIQVISILQKLDPYLLVVIMADEEDFTGDSLELEREIRTKGIFYYLLKPVEGTELRKVVGEAVRCSKRARGIN